MRRTFALGLVVLALPLAAAGCASQEKARAGATLQDYLSDFAGGRAQAACALLTPQAQAAMHARINGLSVTGCQATISRRMTLNPSWWKPRLDGIVVTQVDIHGDRAAATTGPESLNGGGPVPMRRIGGRWLITAPPDLKVTFTAPDSGP